MMSDNTNHSLNMGSFLYVWKDVRVYFGPAIAHLEKHTGASYLFGVNLDGDIHTSIDDGQSWVTSKSVLFRPGCCRECVVDGELIAYIIYEPCLIHGRLIENCMQKHIGKGFFIDIYDVEDFISSCYLLFEEAKQPNEILSGLGKHLFPENVNISKYYIDRRIIKLVEYIQLNLTRDITVSVLAEYARLSCSRLQHLFKEETHLTLRQYISWVRMRHACELIMHNTKITTAGLMSGFSHGSHFSHVYKRLHGFSFTSFCGTANGLNVRYLEPETMLSRINNKSAHKNITLGKLSY